jgi:hypothetical protein
MADFTTWAALKTAILNDLSNGSVLTKSYSIEGRSRTFQDLGDVQAFLQYCEGQILAASRGSTVNYVGFGRPR